jgi:hypothetical protein
LEGHRHLTLIIRAAVDGIIDYSKADVTNPTWHKRLNIILREIIEKDKRELFKLSMAHSLAYLPVSNITEDSWKYHSEKAFEMYDNYYRSTYSMPKVEGDRKKRMTAQLQSAWSEEFGDLNDPKVKEDIEKVTQGLKAANRRARRPLSGNK